MRELKIGDKVRIIPRDKVDNPHKWPYYISDMTKYGGREFIIDKINANGNVRYEGYDWSHDWLELIPEESTRVY